MRAILTALTAILLLLPCAAAAQSVLRIGLNDDPDALDPTISRAYTGRLVFAALCDKLFDVTPDLKIVPQLATGYEWAADRKSIVIKLRPGVRFQDGEPFNAEAVKFNIERHQNTPGLVPQDGDRRDRQRGRGERPHGAIQPLAAARAPAGHPDRPRRHDGLAQGGEGARRQAGHPAGVRRPLQVRPARGPGQDRGRARRRLLGQGRLLRRPHRVRAHHRLDVAPGQPALRRPAHDRARVAHRPGRDPRRQPS